MNKKNKKNKKKTRKNGMRKKNKTKIRSRVGNSTFIDKSKLITIDIFDSTGDVGDNDDETAASRDSGLSPDDDQTINPGKPDLLALLKDIISPLIS